jgi:hypothetical protein
MNMKVKQSHISVLEALAEYRFLTPSQFVKLGIRSDVSNMNKILREMKNKAKPDIENIDLKKKAGNGSFEYVYYLSETGKRKLIEDLGVFKESIKAPKKTTQPYYPNDFPHRLGTMNFQIMVHTWADSQQVDIKEFRLYFEKEPKNQGLKKGITRTTVQYDKDKIIHPDSVIKLSIDKREIVVLFEYHRGFDIKKFERQAEAHIEAMKSGKVKERFATDRPSRVLWVFEEETAMRTAMKRLREDRSYEQLTEAFLFKSYKEVEQELFHNWLTFNGRRLTLMGTP